MKSMLMLDVIYMLTDIYAECRYALCRGVLEVGYDTK